MTPEEQEQQRFMQLGRDHITRIAQATDSFESYARTFEVRGGTPSMGDYGDETLDMISFWNRLKGFLSPENQVILDKYRMDY